MPTSTVEQYVKTIYMIQRRSDIQRVPMKVLADEMGVSPGTATAMAKHLAMLGFVDYQPRRGTILSESGSTLALKIVRRHRLIETFLEQVLHYDWSEVHTDAEELEHVVSDRFVERIDAMLGHPAFDPHGDPIPRNDGTLVSPDLLGLDRTIRGQTVEVARLIDARAELLATLKEHEVTPGKRIEIIDRNDVTSTMQIRSLASKKTLSLSYDVAASIMVLKP